MRGALILRQLTGLRLRGLLGAQCGEFLFQTSQFIAQCEHSLVLLCLMFVQMGITFLQSGQSFGISHGAIAHEGAARRQDNLSLPGTTSDYSEA